jgi:hypothetical protein
MATTSQPGRNPGNIERCLATPPGVERTYMLLGREDNVVCGAFALRQRAPHRLDCGYVLARRWWKHGLMTEILTDVTTWALRQRSIFRIGAVLPPLKFALTPDVMLRAFACVKPR